MRNKKAKLYEKWLKEKYNKKLKEDLDAVKINIIHYIEINKLNFCYTKCSRFQIHQKILGLLFKLYKVKIGYQY